MTYSVTDIPTVDLVALVFSGTLWAFSLSTIWYLFFEDVYLGLVVGLVFGMAVSFGASLRYRPWER